MKVAFVHFTDPPRPFNSSVAALAPIARAAGCEVASVEVSVKGAVSEAAERIERAGADVIAVTAFTRDWPGASAVLARLGPGPFVVVGGYHATFAPRDEGPRYAFSQELSNDRFRLRFSVSPAVVGQNQILIELFEPRRIQEFTVRMTPKAPGYDGYLINVPLTRRGAAILGDTGNFSLAAPGEWSVEISGTTTTGDLDPLSTAFTLTDPAATTTTSSLPPGVTSPSTLPAASTVAPVTPVTSTTSPGTTIPATDTATTVAAAQTTSPPSSTG